MRLFDNAPRWINAEHPSVFNNSIKTIHHHEHREFEETSSFSLFSELQCEKKTIINMIKTYIVI